MNDVVRFEHGGATLVDEVAGDSADRHIVFLHGWGATRDSLRGIGALFEPTHRVHLIDLPGFGEAPAPPSDWDTTHYTALLRQYLLSRVAGSVVLVGHSFGGKIAVRMGASQMPQVHAIVLIAVPGLPASPYTRARIRGRAIRALRRVLRAFQAATGPGPLDWHTRTFGSRDYLAAGGLRPIFVRIVNENLAESAKKIACPVLLIWGSDDRETPPWLAYRFERLMNGRATLEMLPHKDHFPQAGTGAHLCAFKIRAWLEAHGGA